MSRLSDNLITLAITGCIITIGVIIIELNFAPKIIVATTASEARQILRDCTAQPGAVATVKTIWAGDPPVPVEYEITCDKSGTK